MEIIIFEGVKLVIEKETLTPLELNVINNVTKPFTKMDNIEEVSTNVTVPTEKVKRHYTNPVKKKIRGPRYHFTDDKKYELYIKYQHDFNEFAKKYNIATITIYKWKRQLIKNGYDFTNLKNVSSK